MHSITSKALRLQSTVLEEECVHSLIQVESQGAKLFPIQAYTDFPWEALLPDVLGLLKAEDQSPWNCFKLSRDTELRRKKLVYL